MKVFLLAGLLGAGGATVGFLALRPEARGQGSGSPSLGNLGSEDAEEGDASSAAAKPAAPAASQPAAVTGPEAESPAEHYPKLDWLQDSNLDALRMEVYKAELRARYLKATADIRDYEKRLSGKVVKEAEAPKPAAPPKPKPKMKLIAVDGKGAIIEVDGRTYSFAKPGDREGKVSLKGVSPDRALVEVDGEEFEARF